MIKHCDDTHRRYKKRWKIEISFAVVKRALAKTTSRAASIRIFLFGISCVLHNLWILTNFSWTLMEAKMRIKALETKNYMSISKYLFRQYIMYYGVGWWGTVTPRKPAPEPVKRVIIRPEIKKCPECQTTLVKKRHKDRIVWTFEGAKNTHWILIVLIVIIATYYLNTNNYS